MEKVRISIDRDRLAYAGLSFDSFGELLSYMQRIAELLERDSSMLEMQQVRQIRCLRAMADNISVEEDT